jgi:cation-transporting ATPase 13A1
MTNGSANLRNRRHVRETDPPQSPTVERETTAAPSNIHSVSLPEENKAALNQAYRVSPLKERGVLSRLDVGPFLGLYSGLIFADLHYRDEDNEVLFTVCFIATMLVHLSVVLLSQWNVIFQATIGYQLAERSGDKIASWTHALVQSTHFGLSNIGDQDAGIVVVQKDENDIVQIVFHDTTFRCRVEDVDWDILLWQSTEITACHATKTSPVPQFRLLRYPVDLPQQFYASWNGHSSLEQVRIASQVYGSNQTLLQLPTFQQLLGEQLVAPFFLFQIFCVVLWSLDEYWYYAIFTLFALLMFESTVAYNRLQSLQRLHRAGHKGDQRIWVQRGIAPTTAATDKTNLRLQWMYVPTKELVPGDMVSLSVAQDGTPTNVPADLLLVKGTAVCDEALLTGESVPQLKQALDVSKGNSSMRLDLQDNACKESILFGGTNLLVGSSSTEEALDEKGTITPDKGVKCIVLRTGFETAQGSLLRTMAHSSRSADGVHTWDTFVFILMLVVCAIGAATWVLNEGWYDERRNRFRLVLHVVIIVTSVVPPELPMELSLAVTNSVAALIQRSQVYCTELFRIPWAGEVDVCCFDKTGTLTSDEMRLRGVRLFESNGNTTKDEDTGLVHPDDTDLPWPVTRVMAACHSLALAGFQRGNKLPRVVGDPLEQAVLSHTGYRLVGNNVITHVDRTSSSIICKSMTILHRFSFSSKLKRMTVLVSEEGGEGAVWALSKGAPETIKQLLSPDTIPSKYDEVSFYHMSRGRRVLAMAYREAGTIHKLQALKNLGRDSVERRLLFAGFLVLDCPLKPDSKSVVTELQASGHKVVMITGDAILTAGEVARQVGIIPGESSRKEHLYRIRERKEKPTRSPDVLTAFECVALREKDGESHPIVLSKEKTRTFAEKSKLNGASFCISGDVLTKIAEAALQSEGPPNLSNSSTADEKQILLHPVAQAVLKDLVPLISVFARHAPHQKEAVVAAFNHGGYHTLMCGDGTNDVGALKRAHVGISIISAPEVEAKQRKAAKKMSKLKKSAKRNGTATRARPTNNAWEESLHQLQEAQEELDNVELGDASVAAPFTSRAVSIKCCKDVIQQGRCTLVTMLQIYKILGVNCLVNAMVLSKLFLHGVKQGDRQLTVLGLGVAALFFFVSRAEPLPTLSHTRPPVSVLSRQALLSIGLQFAVHIVAILLATETSLRLVDPYDPSLVPDGPFNPNVLNTCTFLLTCVSTINTFAVNYRGRPFMQDLRENRMLYRSLQLSYLILALSVWEVFPPLNDLLQLTALPNVTELLTLQEGGSNSVGVPLPWMPLIQTVGFPAFLSGLMVVDTVLAFQVESMVLRYVPD